MKEFPVPGMQLFLTVFGGLLVVTFYTFPRSIVEWTVTAAPWAIVAAGALNFLLVWPVLASLLRFPGKGLTDLAIRAGGRPLAVVTTLLMAGALLLHVGLWLRQVSEMVVTALYPHTPQTFAMTSLLVASALGAAMPVEGALWLGAIYVWPLLLSLMLLLVGNVGWGQLRNAFPLSGHGILPTLLQVPNITSYYEPMIYLAVFSPFLNRPGRQLIKGAAACAGAAALTWGVMILIYLMVLPVPGGLGVPFPLFEMSRLVQGGRFLERIDAVWVIFWTFGAASQMAISLLAASLLFRDTFRLPDHRAAVLPLAMATVAIALFPTNQADAIGTADRLVGRWGFMPIFVWPALLALVAWIRTRFFTAARARGGSASG